jgi:hypothetical protein
MSGRLGDGIFTIGPVDVYGSPEWAMSVFSSNPQQVFPFPVGCKSFKTGGTCGLDAQLGPQSEGIVRVSTVATAVRFTVISTGYFDSKGSTITFSTVQRNGTLYLRQGARAISTSAHTGIGVALGGALSHGKTKRTI